MENYCATKLDHNWFSNFMTKVKKEVNNSKLYFWTKVQNYSVKLIQYCLALIHESEN